MGTAEFSYTPAKGNLLGREGRVTVDIIPPCENSDPSNLICNGDFELGKTSNFEYMIFPKRDATVIPPWQAFSGSPDFVTTFGSRHVQFAPTIQNPEAIQGRFRHQLIAGQRYKLSLDAFMRFQGDPILGEANLKINFDTNTNFLLSSLNGNPGNYISDFQLTPDAQLVAEKDITNTGWVKHEFFITPSKEHRKIIISGGPDQYISNDLLKWRHIDNIILVPVDDEGNQIDPSDLGNFEITLQPESSGIYLGSSLSFNGEICNKSNKIISPPLEIKGVFSPNLSHLSGFSNFPFHMMQQNFAPKGESGDCQIFSFNAKSNLLSQIGDSVDVCLRTTKYTVVGNKNCAKAKIKGVDFAIEKKSIPQTNAEIGQKELRFEIKLTNASDDMWINPAMVDVLPAELDYISSNNGNINYDKQTGALNYIGQVAPKSAFTFELKYKIIDCKTLSNTASIKEMQTIILANLKQKTVVDNFLENNSSTVSTNPSCTLVIPTKATLGAIGESHYLIQFPLNGLGSKIQYNGESLPVLIPFSQQHHGFPFIPAPNNDDKPMPKKLCETIERYYLT